MKKIIIVLLLACMVLSTCSCKKKNNEVHKQEISRCKAEYQSDVQKIKETEYEKLVFDQTKFGKFGEFSSIKILKHGENTISADESIEIIKKWLTSIGKDDIDLEIELRDSSPQYERNETEEYPYDYVAVYDKYPVFSSGHGFFINTNDCYIQMGLSGIYSVSDGSITEYLKLDSLAAMDAMGVNSCDVVENGYVDDLSEQSYELTTGEISIGECSDMVKNYFESGEFYPCAEGITVDIPYIRVFKLADKYGYDFNIRRVYNDIPFAYADTGNTYKCYGDYVINEDIKHAYVIKDGKVAAFIGTCEGDSIIEIGEEQTTMVDICSATEMLDDFLADNLKVNVTSVELVYCPITEQEEELIYPCWRYSGVSMNDNQQMTFYVNAMDGQIYYYSIIN